MIALLRKKSPQPKLRKKSRPADRLWILRRFGQPSQVRCFLCQLLVSLAFTLSSASANSVAPLADWGDSALTLWWSQHPTPESWKAAVPQLYQTLAQTYAQNGASVFSDPSFQNWTEHLEWLELGLNDPDLAIDAAQRAAFIALGQEPDVSHLLVRHLLPTDDSLSALKLLLSLESSGHADLHDFAALGVAFCIVFDQPFPDDWPHSQVAIQAVPIGDLSVPQRFAFYVAASRAKRTAFDLTTLSVDELKHVVDSEIRLSELTYAQQNTTPLRNLDRLFFAIKYDESRYQPPNVIYNWPLSSYLLSDILSHSGICVDQAYFAAMVGKGRGIPTISFTGEGMGGGHAWFGYLQAPGHWVLDCGRYELQNYPRGHAFDPQNWSKIDDTEIVNFATKISTDPAYPAARAALHWALLPANQATSDKIFDDARQLLPGYATAWRLEGDFLDRAHADTTRRQTFYQDWATQFQSDPIMKTEGQNRLLALLKTQADPAASDLAQHMVVENESASFDLGIDSSYGVISDKIHAGDWEGAQIEYKNVLNTFNAQGGATLYQKVVYPYIKACLNAGQIDQAADAMRFTAERFRLELGSDLSAHLQQLQSLVATEQNVAQAMTAWLDEIDRGSYPSAWSEGPPELQQAIASSAWGDTIDAMRKPFGFLQERKLTQAPVLSKSVKLASGVTISGLCLTATYRSSFDHAPKVEEKVTFRQDPGKPEKPATWRPIDYEAKAIN